MIIAKQVFFRTFNFERSRFPWGQSYHFVFDFADVHHRQQLTTDIFQTFSVDCRRRIANIPGCNGSQHIIDFCALFSPVIQRQRVKGSHYLWLCSRLRNCFSLILCLFETCSKEKPSALSCPNATLFCECVFSDKNSSWAC